MSVLTSLAFMILLSLFLGFCFQKGKLPPLMGMLLAGILLGPGVLNIIPEGILGISGDLRQFALVGCEVDLSYVVSAGAASIAVLGAALIFRMIGAFVTDLSYRRLLSREG